MRRCGMVRGSSFVAVIALALGALGACSSDDDSGKKKGGSGGSATGGSAGASGSGGSAMGGSAGKADTGPACDNSDSTLIQTCKDMAAAMGFAGTCEEIAYCVCDSCTCELQACQNDSGCVAIRDCAADTGCRGVACYTGPCKDTIDGAGGPLGPSATLALNLSTCTEAAMCPTACPDAGGGDSGAAGAPSDGGGGAPSDSGGGGAPSDSGGG